MSFISTRQARRFDLLVFDWDGTLADSTAIIAAALQGACRDLGIRVPDDRAARYVIGLGLDDALRHVAPELDAARHPELSARYREHYLRGDPDIPLFAGVPELLAELAQAGYRLGIATGKSRRGLDRALQQQGLDGLFEHTRCADEGRPKPHPEMLWHVMERTGMRAEQTLMIGDTTHDMELARNAGVAALGVSYGAHPFEDFAPFGPLAVVHSIDEMKQWIKRC